MEQILDISVGLPCTGAEYAIARELTQGDAALLSEARGITAPTVKTMRETHHQLARLLASGMKQVEASAITGFSQSRISILKQDPAFQELITHYREVVDSSFADVQGQLASLSVDVIGELRDRLHDSPDGFRTRELMDFMTSLLDRSGHGPTAKLKTENTNIFVTGDELAKLKQIAKETQCGHVTDKFIALPTSQGVQGSERTEMGEVVALRPTNTAEAPERV